MRFEILFNFDSIPYELVANMIADSAGHIFEINYADSCLIKLSSYKVTGTNETLSELR